MTLVNILVLNIHFSLTLYVSYSVCLEVVGHREGKALGLNYLKHIDFNALGGESSLVLGNDITLVPLGGVSTLLVGVAIGSSLGMVLPISTPPNAIAASTGMIEQKDMVKTGLIMGVLGLVIGYGMLIVLGSSGFFG